MTIPKELQFTSVALHHPSANVSASIPCMIEDQCACNFICLECEINLNTYSSDLYVMM